MITADTTGLENLVKELKSVHRSKFPNAVRFTLNDMAFDAKKNTLPLAYLEQSGFTIRKPQVIKAFTGVQKAVGWETATMFSEVGFKSELGGRVSKASAQMVKNMYQQDEGGTVKSTQTPLKEARGGSTSKTVRSKNFWKNIKIKATVSYGDKQGLIKAVIKSSQSGEASGIIYGKFLYTAKSYKKVGKRGLKMKLSRLYEINETKKTKLTPRHFTAKAAQLTGAKLDAIFTKNAERQLTKLK